MLRKRLVVIGLLLGGLLASVLLGGCAEVQRQVALLHGCDPVAMEAGYCRMPTAPGGKP